MKIKVEEIAIKVKITEAGKIKAIIALDFDGIIVKGFRVMDSQYTNEQGDNLWLTPPVYQAGSRWHPIFFIPDKDYWTALEKRIWEEYYKERDEHFRKRLDISPEDLADIKF